MPRSGIITPLILIAAVAALYMIANARYAKLPNSNSQEMATTINPYPNSTNWQISNKKQLCLYYLNKCQEVPSQIKFSSGDMWPAIYSHFKIDLTKNGWSTNSKIVTSIPTSIVFTNDTYFNNLNCAATLKEDKSTLLSILKDKNTQIFKISVICF